MRGCYMRVSMVLEQGTDGKVKWLVFSR